MFMYKYLLLYIFKTNSETDIKIFQWYFFWYLSRNPRRFLCGKKWQMTTSGNCAFSPKLPFFLRHSFQKDLSPDQLQKSAIRLINFRKEGLALTFWVWIALFSCLRPTWPCVQGGMFLQRRWFTQTNIRFVCSRRFVEATTRFVRTTPRDFWRSENWCISTNFCHPGGSALHCRESRRCQTTLQSKGRILSPHPGVLRILTRFVGRIVVVRILG